MGFDIREQREEKAIIIRRWSLVKRSTEQLIINPKSMIFVCSKVAKKTFLMMDFQNEFYMKPDTGAGVCTISYRYVDMLL